MSRRAAVPTPDPRPGIRSLGLLAIAAVAACGVTSAPGAGPAAGPPDPLAIPGDAAARSDGEAYGLIGQIIAAPGRREELIEILLEGARGMPGCISYVVARDATSPDAIWVTEVWESREHHEASLRLPAVRAGIERGRPLIAGFGARAETVPVGWHLAGGSR